MPEEKPPTPTNAAGQPSDIAPGAPPPPASVSPAPMNLPPISLEPKPKPKLPTVPPSQAKKDHEIKDSFRELIETVVFVVVLVLMLKTFLAEAFVIPTGSMADTLLGYHHKVRCSECGYPNLVNASYEAEPRDPNRAPKIVRWQCVNCKLNNVLRPDLAKEMPP